MFGWFRRKRVKRLLNTIASAKESMDVYRIVFMNSSDHQSAVDSIASMISFEFNESIDVCVPAAQTLVVFSLVEKKNIQSDVWRRYIG